MRLERHVGGLSRARKVNYLTARGWVAAEGGWQCERLWPLPLPVSKALHHQLTEDLTAALVGLGWKVIGYSQRGYARMESAQGGPSCSLPAALRKQARVEKRAVGELTYSLFLRALVDSGA